MLKILSYGLLLFISTFLWMAIPYNNGFDMEIHKWIGAIKMAIPFDVKPKSNDIIFVDVSKSKYLLPIKDDSLENEVVTNRKLLIQLFNQIIRNGSQVNYIFCDLIFDIPSEDDSALKKSILSLRNKFLATNNYEDSFKENILKVRAATTSLYLQNDAVYKIPIKGSFHDTLLPSKALKDIDGVSFQNYFLFTYFKHRGLAFNTQINDYPLRDEQFENGGYVKIGLGQLVSLLNNQPDVVFNGYLKNRFVIIGDFENDKHDTYLNKQSGSIILFNAYWHLKNNLQILSFWYLLVLYLFICFIVWLRLVKKTFSINFPIVKNHEFSINFLSITILLSIFTIISSLYFRVNICIFHLVLIFSIIDFYYFSKKILKKYILNLK